MSVTKTLNLSSTFASCPSTVRAQPVLISADAAGKQIAYPCGNTVVVRSVENPSKFIVCTRHSTQVTVARLAPSGFVCASGDKDGNVLVWANKEGCVVQLTHKALAGPVRDIAWSDDQERLVAVGEGREAKAAVFAVNGGNQIGSIIGHSKTIQACDFRKSRPFRIATGGQDSVVAFHEGPPFKFSKSHTDASILTSNVNCVKFSPDGGNFVAVSGSKEVVVFDGKTGDKVRTITTDHSGSIYAVAWSPDGNVVATASADKTVKLYSFADGALIATHAFGTGIEVMQQGITSSVAGWLAVGLGGDITVLDSQSAAPRAVWRGHARHIVGLVPTPDGGRLVSFGADGKILVWDSNGDAAELVKDGKQDTVADVAVARDGAVFVAAGEDLLVADVAEFAAKTIVKGEAAHPVAVAALDNGAVALVYKNAVKVLVGGTVAAEAKLPNFDAASADGFGDRIAVGGDKAVKVLRFIAPSTLAEELVFAGSHTTSVSAVKFSPDGASVASGDTNRQIFVWNASTGGVLYDDLVFHTSRINSLAWGPAGQWLASGSVDSSVILWDLPNKKHTIQSAAHQGGVSVVVFSAAGDAVFSAGGDCCIRRWTW